MDKVYKNHAEKKTGGQAPRCFAAGRDWSNSG